MRFSVFLTSAASNGLALRLQGNRGKFEEFPRELDQEAVDKLDNKLFQLITSPSEASGRAPAQFLSFIEMTDSRPQTTTPDRKPTLLDPNKAPRFADSPTASPTNRKLDFGFGGADLGHLQNPTIADPNNFVALREAHDMLTTPHMWEHLVHTGKQFYAKKAQKNSLLVDVCSENLHDHDHLFTLQRCTDDTVVHVFGDTHGHFYDTVRLVRSLDLYHADKGENSKVRVIFNGDFVDRGPQNAANLLFLLWLQATLPHNVLLLRGNHETHVNSATATSGEKQHRHWLSGRPTLGDESEAMVAKLPKDRAQAKERRNQAEAAYEENWRQNGEDSDEARKRAAVEYMQSAELAGEDLELLNNAHRNGLLSSDLYFKDVNV